MDQVRKAMDTLVTNHNFERQDLSSMIALQDGPIRPLLQAQTMRAGQTVPAIGVVPARGETHYWTEQGLIAPNGTTAGYAQGGKPATDVAAPVRINNTVARFGKTAAVTDTMAATWTGAGQYRLMDGELERLFTEALDFDTELKMSEVLNEIEWCMVNGNAANNTNYTVPASPSQAATSGSIVSQFNGLLEILCANSANSAGFTGTANSMYGGATILDASTYGTSGMLTEQMIRDLAKQMAKKNTPYRPDLLIVTADQQEVINSFHPQIITMQSEGLVGGSSTDTYNTGISKVTVAYEPNLPAGYMILTNTRLLNRADLIKLGTEPLARVQTQVERMITCEMSMEVWVQKAHGVVKGLAY